MITVNLDLPTDNNDVLNGSALDPIPYDGLLAIYLASSQRDGILTVGGPAASGGALRVNPVLRASGIPDINADIPYTLPVRQGQKVIVAYDEVTAGDAFFTAILTP